MKSMSFWSHYQVIIQEQSSSQGRTLLFRVVRVSIIWCVRDMFQGSEFVSSLSIEIILMSLVNSGTRAWTACTTNTINFTVATVFWEHTCPNLTNEKRPILFGIGLSYDLVLHLRNQSKEIRLHPMCTQMDALLVQSTSSFLKFEAALDVLLPSLPSSVQPEKHTLSRKQALSVWIQSICHITSSKLSTRPFIDHRAIRQLFKLSAALNSSATYGTCQSPLMQEEKQLFCKILQGVVTVPCYKLRQPSNVLLILSSLTIIECCDVFTASCSSTVQILEHILLSFKLSSFWHYIFVKAYVYQ